MGLRTTGVHGPARSTPCTKYRWSNAWQGKVRRACPSLGRVRSALPLTAVETAIRVTRAAVSAVETTRAALVSAHRIRHLRAFVELWPDVALDRAAEVDALVADGARLPMAGVPLVVKAVEGTGSHQARRLIAAGAVPIGATSVPGPGTRWKTWGHTDKGPTLNPWRADRVPGGSSAGSAVAVATGVVPLATASDGAGSTRIPAAWCGVLGYKPTTGLLPARDQAGLTVGGPIARTVSDLDLYKSCVLGGEVIEAPTKVRVAWSPTLGYNRPDPEVVSVAERALRRWAQVSEVTISEPELSLTDPAEAWLARRKRNSHICPGAHPDVEPDNDSALAELFDSVDLLATPTTPNPPHPHSGPGEVMSVGFTWLFNLTGHPALSLPSGFTSDGLPVGLQLVARHHEDALLLASARSAELALPSPSWPLV